MRTRCAHQVSRGKRQPGSYGTNRINARSRWLGEMGWLVNLVVQPQFLDLAVDDAVDGEPLPVGGFCSKRPRRTSSCSSGGGRASSEEELIATVTRAYPDRALLMILQLVAPAAFAVRVA